MKKLFIFSLLFTGLFANAQAPQAMNYQAVARTSNGAIIQGQGINVRFSILDGSVSGAILYQETQQATTNNYGLFTVAIGKGSAVTGTFSGINWGSGTDKFLKVEISADGTANYQLQGTTQLLSVPYALYSAKTNLVAGNGITVTNGNTISGNYTAGTGININGSTISGAYQAGTGISINGATISHALQAGTGINITGSTISGAYTGGTGINITGSTISGAYQGGNAINITGSTISANYTAGTGISINGNVISSSLNNYWLPDTYGIYYQNNSGGIGVGGNSQNGTALTVTQKNTGGVGSAAAVFQGTDTWHTVLRLENSTTNQSYQITTAGVTNTAMPVASFGIYNATSNTWVLNTDGTANSYLGIGSYTLRASLPKSRLHVFNGDVNIDQIGSGIIMKSPNGQCWRITIDNSGNLVRTAIACP